MNDRIKSFFSSLSFAESIDSLDLTKAQKISKKADYLLANRRVIVELKSLEADPEHKAQSELDKHRGREDFPVFFGAMEFSKILKHLPDGADINESVFYKVSRSIEQSIREADKQIKATKEIFDCNNSFGILVLLNESIDILSPHVIAHRVSQQLTKKDPDGTPHYKNISCVWTLIENCISTHNPQARALPSIFILGPMAEESIELKRITDLLQEAWANHCGVPLIHSDSKRVESADFTKLSSNGSQSEPKVRHEIWREQYRKSPYLRNLSDAETLAYGKKVTDMMRPHFVVGGKKLPNSVVAKLMKEWTHFLEEAKFRGLNLKHMR